MPSLGEIRAAYLRLKGRPLRMSDEDLTAAVIARLGYAPEPEPAEASPTTTEHLTTEGIDRAARPSVARFTEAERRRALLRRPGPPAPVHLTTAEQTADLGPDLHLVGPSEDGAPTYGRHR